MKKIIKTVDVNVDFGKVTGRFKPMHGVGQPPMTGLTNSLFGYLTRAGIPYSRLHDVGGWLGGGLYVDIPNLFRDFDADENDPASYDFAFTDKIICGLCEAGCQPYFRLGVTIENMHMLKSYRIFPPKDFEKWARICEHVIRHYNYGWADGYELGIVYWEIWNEPDDCYKEKTSAMWKGTPEEYYRLYSVTAKHLKSCFGDEIKVGGYGHCGVYEYANDKDLEGLPYEDKYIYDFVITFLHGFLKYQKKTEAPIDFFSWHVYDNCHESTRNDFRIISEHADYIRRLLDKYGYEKTEHHLNEWNLWTDRYHRDATNAAAKSLGFMLMMQNTSTDVMCFYDAGLGFSDYKALINSDTGYPYRNYYSFMMFNTLYRIGDQVSAISTYEKLFIQAAANGGRAALVISNTESEEIKLNLDLKGFDADEVQILRIDEENRYTLTGEDLSEGSLMIPPYGCLEIKFFRIN